MTQHAERPTPAPPTAPATLPIGPSAEAWRAMSAAEQERFLIQVNECLTADAQQRAMSEGQPHHKARASVLDTLGRYLSGMGKQVYLATNLSVVYPEEEVFEPDVLAVLDVAASDDNDTRMSWVVVKEGRGLDWVLEVHYQGDRRKDFVRNVERYARLGIAEYFIYDRSRQTLTAYRLSSAAARSYQPIKGHFGRYPSQVLSVELAVIGGRLRFFAGEAELAGTPEIMERLGRMMDELQTQFEVAETRAEEERSQAEEARSRAEAAEAQIHAERARILENQRRTVQDILVARGLAVSDAVTAALVACADEATLARWIVRAATVTDGDAVVRPGA